MSRGASLKVTSRTRLGDFLEEAVIDIDELSRDEIDEACKIVSLGIRDVEAANAMAVNTGPRMLVADLADSAYAREKVSAALREATANHEVALTIGTLPWQMVYRLSDEKGRAAV